MLTAIGILLVFISQAMGQACPNDWIHERNSCYLYITNKETWMEANNACLRHDATLVAIESAAEDTFIKGFINGFGGLGADMRTWIGGTDMDIEGVWKWSPSGEPFTYTAWFPGQPQKPDGGDCLVLWKHDSTGYTWGDYACHELFPFMCEKHVHLTGDLVG